MSSLRPPGHCVCLITPAVFPVKPCHVWLETGIMLSSLISQACAFSLNARHVGGGCSSHMKLVMPWAAANWTLYVLKKWFVYQLSWSNIYGVGNALHFDIVWDKWYCATKRMLRDSSSVFSSSKLQNTRSYLFSWTDLSNWFSITFMIVL